ncbi:MAG: hypothetical protein Q9191_004485 [Dirinaria sp. TL-2023a]
MTIVQIYLLNNRYAGSSDPTFDLWLVILVTEIVQSLSLITACIPYLKPFLQALETGMIRANGGAQIHGYGTAYGSGSSKRLKPLSSKGNRRQLNGVRMNSLGYAPGEGQLGGNLPNHQTVTVTSRRHAGDSDGDSQSSESKIIKKTVGWSVTSDEGTIQLPPNTHLEYPPKGQSGPYARAV